MPGPAFSIDELLAHADWLRRLAAQVARGDDAGAEDAVQETFVAALRAPPGRDRPAQPWLAEVLRNFVRRALRGQRARAAREAVTEVTALATPDELLERAQAQRLLADLVMGLEEPFRATVLLRYFEGQSAAEIARATGVPAGTVRWRLQEGLARLRAGLEARDDGKRWLALLAPLPRASLWLKGGLLVATAKKAVAGLVLLVIALLAGVLLWRGQGTQAPATRVTERQAAAPRFAPALAAPRGEVVADDPPTATAGSVEGIVRSAEDGTAIASAELSFAFQDSSLPTTTSADGRFRFAPAEAGTYLLARIAAEGFQSFAPEWGDSPVAFVLRPGERVRGVERPTLRAARTCRGMVVDEGGKPVAGARLSYWSLARGSAPPAGDAASDGKGQFTFPAGGGTTVEAHAGDRMAREQLGAALPPCQLSLRLGPPRAEVPLSIEGRVERAGVGLPGVVVEAWANPVLEREARHGLGRGVTDGEGHFTLAPLDAVAYGVSAHLGGRELAVQREVRGGARGVVLRVAPEGRLRGDVRDEAGGAVSRFSVVVSRADAGAEGRRAGLFTRYDARGAFDIEGLPAGAYHVLVVAEGFAPSEEQPAVVAPGPEAAAVRVVLRRGGRVQGRVVDCESRTPLGQAMVSVEGKAGVGSTVPLATQTLSGDDGRFGFGGLPEGRLSLMITAGGHHGRVIGGLEATPGKVLELPDVELGGRKEGEPARIELIGIGASLAINSKGDAIVLGTLSPKGGAARAGLVPGDAIVAIDGRAVSELGFSGAIQRIRGAENTPVVLKIHRATGSAADVIVIRQLVSW